MTRTIQHRIDGRETAGESSRTAPVWNPATGEHQADVLPAEPADADAAVQAARAALPGWADTSVMRRSRLMFAFRDLVEKHLDDLARIVSARDPSASNLVAGLYVEAGLPDGVFNVVHGGRVAV